MRRLLATGCCAIGLAVPAAALAAGGPVPSVTGGAGVYAPGRHLSYATLSTPRGTIVERLRWPGGFVTGVVKLRERLAVPGATFNGDATGLSADGRTLVLTGPSTRRTRLVVLDAAALRVRSTISLPGYSTVDAISPDGRWLYLIQYRSPVDPLHYQVRAYDVRAGRLLAKPIVDPREPDEKMQGTPWARTTSADGRWVYTLYTRASEVPFIHALDTSGRTARCIDVPRASNDSNVRLRIAAPGTLTVIGPNGPEALVDTRTFAVRAPKLPALVSAPVRRPAPAPDGGGPPWILLLVAAPVVLAGLALIARRRRPAPPVMTIERRQHVTD